jgi:hypothetical protein
MGILPVFGSMVAQTIWGGMKPTISTTTGNGQKKFWVLTLIAT